MIHYAIFLAQRVNIIATSRAGLGSAILSVNGSIAPSSQPFPNHEMNPKSRPSASVLIIIRSARRDADATHRFAKTRYWGDWPSRFSSMKPATAPRGPTYRQDDPRHGRNGIFEISTVTSYPRALMKASTLLAVSAWSGPGPTRTDTIGSGDIGSVLPIIT